MTLYALLGVGEPADPRRLGAMRVTLGLYLVLYLSAFVGDIELLFSDRGVYAPYLLPDLAPPPWLARMLFAIMLGLSIAVMVGYRSRLAIACFLPLYLHHYFLQLAIKQSSFERLILIVLGLLLFDAGDGAYALRKTTPQDRFVPRMILLQLSALYIGSGLWKVLGPQWQDGRLLYSTFQGIFATPWAFAITRMPLTEGFWNGLARTVAYGEVSLGLMFLSRGTRPWAAALGTAFHLANVVLLAIPEFTVCIALYPLCLRNRAFDRLDQCWVRLTARHAPSAS